ncbi:hypothetical protein M8037_16685 [Sinorhizobium meliloti]|uniref:hypothetical protein n=1 Tax=Rhizobium meliloti TaxID=382 RepID=UPI002072BFBC|nr:hypothetical protein [Sinorhizobium meliloti]MCM5690402.1 hypothetical protein [Sinorhizobium meliloti]
MLSNFDELIHRIPDVPSRAHIREAIRCYEAGANRAAIVSAYIALCFNLIEKLRLMADAGDGRARSEIGKLDEATEQMRAGSGAAIKTVLDFERTLLELFYKDLEFFDTHEYLDLQRVRDDRNRCAHPTLLQSGVDYNPPAELARLHIRSVIAHVLAQPPRHGRAAIAALKALILSPFFPETADLAKQRLEGSEMANARPALVNAMVDELAFGWPNPASDYHLKQSALSALWAIAAIHKAEAIPRLSINGTKLLKRSEESSVHLGAYIGLRYPDVGHAFDAPAIATMITWLAARDDDYTSTLVTRALDNPKLRDSAIAKAASLSAGHFSRHEGEPAPEVLARAVQLYCGVKEWGDANAVATKCAIPLAQWLNEDHVKTIFAAAASGAADLRGSHQFPKFIGALYQRNRLGKENLDTLLAAFGLGNYLPEVDVFG